jgi:hypothetical protein
MEGRNVKRHLRSFRKTLRSLDWLDVSYLVFIAGCGVAFQWVVEELQREFS